MLTNQFRKKFFEFQFKNCKFNKINDEFWTNFVNFKHYESNIIFENKYKFLNLKFLIFIVMV